MQLNQRSRGSVDSDYFPAKEKLETTRRKGFCMICQIPLVKGEKNSGRKYHRDCWEKWFGQFRPPMLWAELRERALNRDKHTCVICGNHPSETSDGLIVDHIKPIALGGEEFDMNNLQTLCTKCNKKKTFYDMKCIAGARRSTEDQMDLLGNSCVWANNLRKQK